MCIYPKEIISEFNIPSKTLYRHIKKIPEIKKSTGGRWAIPKKREVLEWIAENFMIDVENENNLETKIQNLLK